VLVGSIRQPRERPSPRGPFWLRLDARNPPRLLARPHQISGQSCHRTTARMVPQKLLVVVGSAHFRFRFFRTIPAPHDVNCFRSRESHRESARQGGAVPGDPEGCGRASVSASVRTRMGNGSSPACHACSAPCTPHPGPNPKWRSPANKPRAIPDARPEDPGR
jgi:hypothetical protein